MKTFLLILGAIASASAGVLHGAVGVAPLAVVPRGHGLEGQWIPDNLERLHDDGSYRPELRPIELSPSPYGLTPSGSGLEGAYVPEARPIELSPTPWGLTPSGSGLEGQYLPEARPIELSHTPWGLTPAGSGLEGKWVRDI